MDIYLIRHGQTTWNREERLQGWKDSPLTDQGKKEAQALARDFSSLPLDQIFSSDLGRALETAKYFLRGRDLELKVRPELRELALGPWEGKLFEEVKREAPQALATYFNHPDRHHMEGVEDYHDLMDRIGSFMEEVRQLEAQRILVVAHGVSVAAICNLIENKPLKAFWDRPLSRGLGITHIQRRGKDFFIKKHAQAIEGQSY
ncbi:MAG: histidine phosphatase family protein [Tissierellia bacterium]|nr:histidine phosphatase family protein [Tissierellia bacterium]